MQKREMRLAGSFIIVFIFIGLIVYTLVSPKPESKIQTLNENKLPSVDNFIEQKTDTNMDTNTNEVRIAKSGDSLVVNYTGKLEDGTVFDSNVDPKFGHVEPFNFTVGAGSVIVGWEEGFLGMKVGEKKTLVIPPEKGYGAQAVSIIPANSTLIFDVELVDIK